MLTFNPVEMATQSKRNKKCFNQKKLSQKRPHIYNIYSSGDMCKEKWKNDFIKIKICYNSYIIANHYAPHWVDSGLPKIQQSPNKFQNKFVHFSFKQCFYYLHEKSHNISIYLCIYVLFISQLDRKDKARTSQKMPNKKKTKTVETKEPSYPNSPINQFHNIKYDTNRLTKSHA